MKLLTGCVLTAFTNRCAAFVSSPSSLSSPSSSLSESLTGTTDVEAVTEALVRAVNYNMQRKYLPTSLMFCLMTMRWVQHLSHLSFVCWVSLLDNVIIVVLQLLTLDGVLYHCSRCVWTRWLWRAWSLICYMYKDSYECTVTVSFCSCLLIWQNGPSTNSSLCQSMFQ